MYWQGGPGPELFQLLLSVYWCGFPGPRMAYRRLHPAAHRDVCSGMCVLTGRSRLGPQLHGAGFHVVLPCSADDLVGQHAGHAGITAITHVEFVR